MEREIQTDAMAYRMMEEKLFETPREADLLIVYKQMKGKSKLSIN